MKGTNPQMYAAIMSERDLPLSDVGDEITKMGFEVVGSELEDLEEIPPNVVLWIMLGFNRIERNPTLPCKYVRVFSPTHPLGKSYYRVVGSPWWVAAYYQIMHWVLFKWGMAKSVYSSLEARNIKKNEGKGLNPQMYVAILCDHEASFEDVRKAIDERGFQVAGSELEKREYPPHNVICLMLFEHRRFGTGSVHWRYVRIASFENEGSEKYFYAVNCPWWSTIYHTVLWQATFKWEKAKVIFSSLK
jgi:hypothetical protein